MCECVKDPCSKRAQSALKVLVAAENQAFQVWRPLAEQFADTWMCVSLQSDISSTFKMI